MSRIEPDATPRARAHGVPVGGPPRWIRIQIWIGIQIRRIAAGVGLAAMGLVVTPVGIGFNPRAERMLVWP
jgi:hypothetical protein